MPRLTRRLEDLDHRAPMFGDERFLRACGVRAAGRRCSRRFSVTHYAVGEFC
jgi:hypothetical protein